MPDPRLIQQKGTDSKGIPATDLSPEIEKRLRKILLTPVPEGSTRRYEALDKFFTRDVPMLEASRLHARLQDRQDPLRKLMETRLSPSSVPKLVATLQRTSFGYSPRVSAKKLDDDTLKQQFEASTAHRGIAPVSKPTIATTTAQILEDQANQEMFEELSARGQAFTPVSDERAEEIQKEILEFTLKQEREAYEKDIKEIAALTGIEEKDVREIFLEYEAQETQRRFAGVIDAKAVPFLNTPMAKSAKIFAELLSWVMPGVGFWEAYFGIDVKGNKLSTGERILSASLELIPFAGKFFGKLAKSTIKTVVSICSASGLHPRRLLPFLKRVGKVSVDIIKQAREKVRQAIRSGTAAKLTKEEREAIEAIDGALAELSGKSKFTADPGASFKPGDAKPPGSRRDEADVPDIVGDATKASGQTLSRAAARKALDLLNRTIASNPAVHAAWRQATNKVMKKFKKLGKTLTRDDMLKKGGLYEQARKELWNEVWDSPAAKKFFEDAGYTFTKKGNAPLHKDFLQLPKELHDEIRITLDHIDPKAINWQKALDANNLRFVHHADNRLVDLIRRFTPDFF